MSLNKKILYLVSFGHCFAINALQAQTAHPNIVFILADDLGASDLGCYGSDFYETPHIDQLASQGVKFDQAYAAGANSAPSRACLMTGMYTPRHGVYTVSPSERGNETERQLIPIGNTDDVAASFTTIAEALKTSNYQCAHVGKWHMGDDEDGTGPLSQGFDLNIGGDRAGSPYSYFYPYCNKAKSKCHWALTNGDDGEYLTDRLTQEAESFIRHRDKNRPFFLYLSHYAVHVPLSAPNNLVDKYKHKKPGNYQNNPVYAAMIEKLDDGVGRINALIEELNLSDNTIFVFCSDNGGTNLATDNFPLRGEKGTPYEGGIRVPLIIKYPSKLKQGQSTNIPVINIDFFPTFVDEAQAKRPKGLDGVNLFDLLSSKSPKKRDLFWHFPAYLESYKGNGFRAKPYTIIRSGDWKLIYDYETKQSQLFNLKDDLSEQQDLALQLPVKRKDLERKLFSWIAAVKAPVPTQLNPKYKHK